LARSSYDPRTYGSRTNTPKRLTLPTCVPPPPPRRHAQATKKLRNAGISSGTGQMCPSGRGATTRQPTSSGMHGSSERGSRIGDQTGHTLGHTQGCMDHQRGDPGLVTRPVTLRPTSNTGACVASSSTPTGSRPHRSSCVHVHPPWVAAVGLDACTLHLRCRHRLRPILEMPPWPPPPHPRLLTRRFSTPPTPISSSTQAASIRSSQRAAKGEGEGER